MKKHDKSDLDDIFSKHLTNDVDDSYKEEFWENFEKQLEAELPVKRKKRIFFWLLPAAALILISYFFVIPYYTSDKPISIPSSSSPLKLQEKDIVKRAKESNNLNVNEFREGAQKDSLDESDKGILSIDQDVSEGLVTYKKVDKTSITQEKSTINKSNKITVNAWNHYSDQSLEIAGDTTQNKSLDFEEFKPIKKPIGMAFMENPNLRIGYSLYLDKETVTDNWDNNKRSKSPNNSYFIKTGANYGSGFSNTNLPMQWTFDPSIGIKYQRKISEQFGFNLELQYLSKRGHQLLQQNEIITLFLDRNIEQNIIITNSIQSLQIPISVSWTVLPNHQLSAGFYLGTLIDTRSIGTQLITINGQTSDINLGESLTGYSAGIKRFNFGLNAGYEFQVFNNWSLEFRFLYGLTDQTKTQVYGDLQKNYSRDFQLSLNYKIFEH